MQDRISAIVAAAARAGRTVEFSTNERVVVQFGEDDDVGILTDPIYIPLDYSLPTDTYSEDDPIIVSFVVDPSVTAFIRFEKEDGRRQDAAAIVGNRNLILIQLLDDQGNPANGFDRHTIPVPIVPGNHPPPHHFKHKGERFQPDHGTVGTFEIRIYNDYIFQTNGSYVSDTFEIRAV